MNVTLKVAALITNAEQKILLIKEQYDAKQGFKWNLVKGTYDNSLETLEGCIKREIKEEVGLEVSVVELRHVYHYGNAENPKVLFIFHAQYNGSEIGSTLNNQSDEYISEVKWFSKEELNRIAREDCIASYVYQAILQPDAGWVIIGKE